MTKFRAEVLDLAAFVHPLYCPVVQQVPTTVAVNMVPRKVVGSSESEHTDQMEKPTMTDGNVVLTAVLSVDEEMNLMRLASVQMDQKLPASVLTAVGHRDRLLLQLQLNEETIHLTLALEALAYNALQQPTLDLAVVCCEDQMVEESSLLVNMDPKLLNEDSLAFVSTCLDLQGMLHVVDSSGPECNALNCNESGILPEEDVESIRAQMKQLHSVQEV